MNIVYFAPRFPLPVTGGDRLLTERYLHAMGRRWKVHFLSFSEDGRPRPELVQQLKNDCQLASVTVLPWPISRIWNTTTAAARLLPLQAAYYYQPAAVHALKRLVAEVQPRAMMVQTVRLLPYLRAIPRNIHKIVHFVDALSRNYQASGQFARSPAHQLLYVYERRRLLELERDALRTMNAGFVVSDNDAEYLRQLVEPGSPLHVIPLGIDAGYFSYRPLAPSPRFRVAFVGRMSTRANADAAVWFAKQVLPRVAARLRRPVEFRIIGAAPARRVRRLQAGTISVSGHVSDIRPLIWESDMTVAPMRIATGIQNKVIQSLALGRPVVASLSAGQGLGPQRIPGVFQADGADATADEIVGLYENYEEVREMMPSASAAVANLFSWEVSLARFTSVVEHLVDRESSASDQLEKSKEIPCSRITR